MSKRKRTIVRVVAIILIVLTLVSFVLPLLTGCSNRNIEDEKNQSAYEDNRQSGENNVGDGNSVPIVSNTENSFLHTGFKIKATLTPQVMSTFDQVIFEVYIDKNGNGYGLCGYKDNVYDVVISSDRVYIKVDANIVAHISDLTGHMIPTTLEYDNNNMGEKGFSLLNGIPVSFKGSTNDLLYSNVYQASDAVFDEVIVSEDNSMTTIGFINYILDYKGSVYISPQTPDTGVTTDTNNPTHIPDKESFWNNYAVGVKIHETIYSIGDYCNPNTYFEDSKPSGIVPSYAYNKDSLVEMLHISYKSSDGETGFMLTDGYVQAIYTTSPFLFVDIYSGMDRKELRDTLGVGLSKKQLETFAPMIEGLDNVKSKGNGYTMTYNDLTITIEVSGKTNTVTSIKIEKYLDFMNTN